MRGGCCSVLFQNQSLLSSQKPNTNARCTTSLSYTYYTWTSSSNSSSQCPLMRRISQHVLTITNIEWLYSLLIQNYTSIAIINKIFDNNSSYYYKKLFLKPPPFLIEVVLSKPT
jgi:hypothetical protein